MVNKRFWLGILLILAVLGVSVSGCSSTPNANFYNLGDVSEENCALIQVSPIHKVAIERNGSVTVLESDYSFLDLVKIDGEGNSTLWQTPTPGILDISAKRAMVRVTPGVHTFTINLIDSEDADYYYLVPLDITYDCKPGKGYVFHFVARETNDYNAAGFFLMGGGKVLLGIFTTTFIINEHNVTENGDLSFLSSEVASKKETLNLSKVTPNDRGRVVKVPKN